MMLLLRLALEYLYMISRELFYKVKYAPAY